MKTMKASELVVDFEFYPRTNVDAVNVRNIADAIAAGAELPPLVIDKKSRRVIDGVHRLRANMRVNGEDAPVMVVEKSYKTEAAMFEDAIRYNASHGANLGPCDRVRCMHIAERVGLTIEQVAGVLHIPIERLGALRDTRTAHDARGEPVALKNTIRHHAGKKLNKRQAEANERLSGMNQVFYVNQLIELIESDLLDTSDENLMARMRHLSELMLSLLAAA